MDRIIDSNLVQIFINSDVFDDPGYRKSKDYYIVLVIQTVQL